MEQLGLAGATIRRKLAALASLFDHLLENNAVAGGNPVHGVKRPRVETNEDKTPALGDDQAKLLLHAPDGWTLKGVRDRAILDVLLYHGLRREKAAQLPERTPLVWGRLDTPAISGRPIFQILSVT